MNVGVIGKGKLGSALGNALSLAGHQVTYGVKEPSGTGESSISDTFAKSEVVLLAVPYEAVPSVLNNAEVAEGLILVDCANPVAPDFSGLSTVGTSSAEQTAKLAPRARVVKAFNTVGAGIIENPRFPDGPPTMPIAADDSEAAKLVMSLASDIGFDAVHTGPLIQARQLESLAWLWISMAYKFGHGGDFAFRFINRSSTSS
jgi:predicted dinucleotide-binding enzyme